MFVTVRVDNASNLISRSDRKRWGKEEKILKNSPKKQRVRRVKLIKWLSLEFDRYFRFRELEKKSNMISVFFFSLRFFY